MFRNHLILGAFVTAGALVFGTAPAVAAPVEVTHRPWRQKQPSWCSPTSVQLSLRTFGVKVTQDTLAEQMNTDSVGTDAADLNRVYNGYLNDLGYEMNRVDGRDPEVLMDAVAHDVGVLGKAVPMGIRGSQASWIDTDSNFGHVVSVADRPGEGVAAERSRLRDEALTESRSPERFPVGPVVPVHSCHRVDRAARVPSLSGGPLALA